MSGSLRLWRGLIRNGQYWIASVALLTIGNATLALGQIPAAPSPAPLPTAETVTRPVLKLGSRGAEVGELQATLKLLGFYTGAVDGLYGKNTIAAVTQFQQAAGLAGDGVTGKATWDRLFPPTEQLPPTASQPTASPTAPDPRPAAASPNPEVTFPILRQGMKGAAVTGLQERLRAIGVLKSASDGVFGAETLAAVKAAQRSFGLEPDGVVGAATWNALLSRVR